MIHRSPPAGWDSRHERPCLLLCEFWGSELGFSCLQNPLSHVLGSFPLPCLCLQRESPPQSLPIPTPCLYFAHQPLRQRRASQSPRCLPLPSSWPAVVGQGAQGSQGAPLPSWLPHIPSGLAVVVRAQSSHLGPCWRPLPTLLMLTKKQKQVMMKSFRQPNPRQV